MSKVYWTTRCPNQNNQRMKAVQELIVSDPIPFSKWLNSNREESRYVKCPAVIDYFKNMFIITAPIDITINVDPNTRYVITNTTQEFYDAFITNRSEQSSENDPLMLTLPPMIVFWSDDDIMMESLPMFLSSSESTENLNLIPGTYNISKWVRPVDFTIEIKDLNKPIHIKRGEPLFCVKFIPKDGKKVELEWVENNVEVENTVLGCTLLKDYIPKQTLNSVYEMAENFIKRFKNSQKRH